MIKVNNVCKKYKKNILNGISFEAEKGDCVIIVGENGCGKSTLLSIMAGALRADKGEIFYSGENVFKKRKLFSKYIGYVPQDNPLIDELSVYDNLRLWYGKDGKAFKKAINGGFADMLGLSEVLKMPVGKLSGGMKKRVSIASSMANEPPIMILDEPSTALDIVCKEDIRNYLNIYLKNGGTIVMTTHETDEMALCTKLFVMKNGILSQAPKETRGKELFELIKRN